MGRGGFGVGSTPLAGVAVNGSSDERTARSMTSRGDGRLRTIVERQF